MIGYGALALAMGLVMGTMATNAARAEVQIQVYGGVNGNFSSDVSVRKPGVVTDNRSIDWDGKSFAMPPYWGARGIYWLDSSPNWGVAIEFTHAKAYAKLGGAAGAVYDRLEFTDGNNIFTANVLHRFDPWLHYRIRPYAGLGVGLAVPHVEVELVGDPGPRTYEYQVTGVAVQGLVGLEMPLGANWSGFIEGKMTYTRIDADLKGGGSLKTDLWSPHLAVGLSYRF
jgi:lipid A oxidase